MKGKLIEKIKPKKPLPFPVPTITCASCGKKFGWPSVRRKRCDDCNGVKTGLPRK